MRTKKTNKREEAFWWAHILIPLALGTVLYLVLNSEEALPAIVGRLFGPDRITVFGHAIVSAGVFQAACVYGRDFLWGYALVFALGYQFRENFSEFKKALTITALFEIGIVVWQFVTAMGGAFDPGHIIAGFIGNVLGILVILIYKRAVI